MPMAGSVGTMRTDRDVIDAMAAALASLGLYVVLAFFAAQFVAFFGWTNLGAISAVTGAELLQRYRHDRSHGIYLLHTDVRRHQPLIGFGFGPVGGDSAHFRSDAYADWIRPEAIQAAYRIGDSTTNIITPMMSYFGLILAWATRYDKNLGVGTMIAIMLPYTIFFLIIWSSFFVLWTFALDLPVGPGSPTYYNP